MTRSVRTGEIYKNRPQTLQKKLAGGRLQDQQKNELCAKDRYEQIQRRRLTYKSKDYEINHMECKRDQSRADKGLYGLF